jgi:hypothetical protein
MAIGTRTSVPSCSAVPASFRRRYWQRAWRRLGLESNSGQGKSGGRLVYDPPDFCVLDEQTDHLDVATKARLEALKDFEGTMIFVSHDRMFLRGLGSRVLELGGESGTDRSPRVFPWSYVEYVNMRRRGFMGGSEESEGR